MDLPVVETLFDRGLDQTVLVDTRETLELRRRHRRPQVVAGSGLVDDLDRRAGQRRGDHPLDFSQVGHVSIVWPEPA